MITVLFKTAEVGIVIKKPSEDLMYMKKKLRSMSFDLKRIGFNVFKFGAFPVAV